MQSRRAAILGGSRIPFTKSFGKYSGVKGPKLIETALDALIEKFQLKGARLGDVALGTLMPYSTEWSFAREAVLSSALSPHTPATSLQRACGTGLEAIWQIAMKISTGSIDSGIAGGFDTNSDLPITLPRSFAWKMMALQQSPGLMGKVAKLAGLGVKDFRLQIPSVTEPRTKLSMGQHTELMVQEWGIGRREQDELALESHKKAAAAYARGFYNDQIVECAGLKADTFVRADTTLEKLGKLKTAFEKSEKGTLSAGNSTPLTDGAAIVLMGNDDFAKERGYKVLAHFVDAEVAAVDFVKGEGLLIAPTIAVSRLLARNYLKLQDFDVYEIHEAFAGQVLCTLKAWESAEYCSKRLGRSQAMGSIDQSKMNLAGGSLALGHPFSATGARCVANAAKLLSEKGGGRALISICTAGGMGIAAILEL
jgi:acetyl-CoA C-acetyltransferase